jgi:hypothetical protein
MEYFILGFSDETLSVEIYISAAFKNLSSEFLYLLMVWAWLAVNLRNPRIKYSILYTALYAISQYLKKYIIVRHNGIPLSTQVYIPVFWFDISLEMAA